MTDTSLKTETITQSRDFNHLKTESIDENIEE